jgi:DNA processing protein
MGCLETGGTTAAILAHGLDTVHPRQHQKVAERLLRKGGCLLSEYPPGTPPRRNHFVLRNRLQSGVSRGTIIIETAIEGGTMHTARFAIAQDRALGCLRPRNGNFGASVAGNQLLLREESAFPLGSREEIDYFIESILGSAEHILTSRRRPITGPAYSLEPSVAEQLSFFDSV